MSYSGHLVVDADCHMREYWDLDRTYKDQMDPEFRETYEEFSRVVQARQKRPGDAGFREIWAQPMERPLGFHDTFGSPFKARSQGNGAEAPSRATTTSGREIDPACNWDPGSRLRDMDEADIDVGVMFPSQSDGLCMLRDVHFESALNRAYHRYMSNFCSESNNRLGWLALTTMRDIPEAVGQLKYWTEKDDSFSGMFLPRAFPDGTLLDSPDLYPLYELTQELDMPLWVHGDPRHPPLTPAPGQNAVGDAAFARQVLKGWGGMTALGALIGGGVFDLFPKLRIGFFENGGGWMPWFVEKLDESYEPGSNGTPKMKRTPSEIVAGGQVFCAVETDEIDLGHCVDRLGDHIWLFSTDYPHSRNPWPDGVPIIAKRTDLSESTKIKMLGGNAVRFLPRLGGVKPATA